MALMDLIGFGADKQAVVIDIGAMYTKVGFAGEYSPRHIIRSEISEYNSGVLNTITLRDIENFASDAEKISCEKRLTDFTQKPINKSEEKTKREKKVDFFKNFFHMLYFKYLLVNPKERRVVVCESMLKSVETRKLIAEILFTHFHVVSLVFVPSHLLALYSCGVETGLVVDLGYLETSVVPIFEQVPILKAVEYVNLAGKSIHEKIKSNILSDCTVQVGSEEKPAHECLNDIKEQILEDIKVRCCFVGRQDCTLTAQPVNYPIDGNTTLHLNGDIRAHAFDMMFSENDDDISITTCILDAIINSPIDCRKGLAENIILIGGGAMSEGFSARMMSELKSNLKTDRYSSKLFLKKICFRKPLIPANYCAWQGGALFGALEILADRSISRERYHVNPLIPDWSSTLAVDPDAANKSLMDEKYKLLSYRKSLPMTPPLPSATSSSLLTTTPASVTERLRRELGLSQPPTPSTMSK